MVGSVAVTVAAAGLGLICGWCVAAPTPTTLPTDTTTTAKTMTDAKQFGEACRDDVQCSVLDQHAVCRDGYCGCDSGFYLLQEHNGSLCDSAGGAARAGNTKIDSHMIVVIAVLAIMFVGICVALHLFSRARFRNRRTIFNSPHPRLMHIKLGKNKKKKLSGSQHLATPQHHSQVPRHHSFSGQHVPSPLPLHRVPKTRSHECLRSAMRRDSSPGLEMRCPPRAPLAERESSSVPSTEDLDKKTPEHLHNGVAPPLMGDQALEMPPGSPTVIVTDADGSHQVVSASARSSPGAGSNKAIDV